eukprot:scaffold126671_cov35-Tisochrysis_lutea.AAC.2
MGGVKVPSSAAEAESALATGACVVNVCASWCEPCTHMNTVFAELAVEHETLNFIQVGCPPLRTFPAVDGLVADLGVLYLRRLIVTLSQIFARNSH